MLDYCSRWSLFGAVGRNRTFDARAFNAALYQLSYNGMERAARIELAGVGLEGQLIALISPL